MPKAAPTPDEMSKAGRGLPPTRTVGWVALGVVFWLWVATIAKWLSMRRDAGVYCASQSDVHAASFRIDPALLRIWCEEADGTWQVGWSGTGSLLVAAIVTVAATALIIIARRRDRTARP